jgi:uncharacterized protein DUF6940
VRAVTNSIQPQGDEWHVRRQRPDARTTLLWFIDADANRMSFAQFLEALESSEAFRAFFMTSLTSSESKAFVWETAVVKLGDEFECAITQLTPPTTKKKLKITPRAYAEHLRPGESVSVFPSPDGQATLLVPHPKGAEGWYAELGVFLRRANSDQHHVLWQTLARTAKVEQAKNRVWLRSSAPGLPWLHVRVDRETKNCVYRPYGR